MSKLLVRIFDGTRQPFAAPAKFLVTITDGHMTQQVRDFFEGNTIPFDLPFYDNAGDNYTVLVWADGYKQAGFMPVVLSDKFDKTLDLMLIPNDPGFSFVNARWNDVSARYPYLAGDVAPAVAEARYDDLLDKNEKPLACLLNLGEAMSQINLAQGTPLDYIKQIRWEYPNNPAQDRFFAWCDRKLIDQVANAAQAGLFAVENNPGLFHPGATLSWKQIQFGEANVQLTFHTNDVDCRTINGVDCVTVEPDIDYFKDLGAHAIYEVIPNALTHSLTDPTQVYVLRWIAGRTAGVPEFNPMYTIVP